MADAATRLEPEKKIRLTQEERSSRTRAKLIAATLDCVRDLGYANVTTTAIAERAGVSRGAMQHQFSTRTELLLAVMDEVVDQLQQPLAAGPGSSATLEERTALIVERYWSVFSSGRLQTIVDIWLGARSDPELFGPLRSHMRAIFRARDRYWHEFFADLDIPNDRLSVAHELTSATARGLALRKTFDESRTRAATPVEIEALKLCIVAILKGDVAIET